MIMFIVAMAQLYGWVLTRERLPQYVFGLMTRITENPQLLLVIVVFGLVVVGCFHVHHPHVDANDSHLDSHCPGSWASILCTFSS